MSGKARSYDRWPTVGLAVGILLVASSCPSEVNGRGTFRVEGLQNERTAVALNEELSLTFSEAVDPTSVSADSLSLVTLDGETARGEWTVAGQVVSFRPSPVRAADLSDGGFRPGTEYVVRVNGFPYLNGLRSLAGTPLDRCTRIGLRTASLDGGDILLEDSSPGECGTLWFPQQTGSDGALKVGALEPIRIHGREPLDPRTLHDDDFWIEATRIRERRWENDPETGKAGWVDVVDEARRIAVRASLRENLHELSSSLPEPRVQIELQPVEALVPGPSWSYTLKIAPFRELRLADFRGNPARRWGRDRKAPLEIRVVDSVKEREGQVSLDFLDTKRLWPLDLPWVDGTAHWGDTGLLGVRYPAAAGDGSDGRVVLRGDESRFDVRATQLALPAGERVRLPSVRGLQILRAQGRLTIDGTLVRAETNGPEPPLDPFSAGADAGGQTLSEWIEKARRDNLDWTVLVAGGDLTINGRVEVDTPLLLVAGGWIRVAGEIVQPPDQLWLMGDGGTTDATASRPGLILDAPSANPLVEPLRVAAITFPVPARQDDYLWRDLEVRGRAGEGSYRVRFLPPTKGPFDPEGALDHPSLVSGGGQVRLLFELTVPPGGPWDPPSIDHVILEWEPRPEDD